MGILNSISGAVSNALPFDPTPGFNLSTSKAGVPFVGATQHPASSGSVQGPGILAAVDTGYNNGNQSTNGTTYTGSTSSSSTAASRAQAAADAAAKDNAVNGYQNQINSLQQLLGSADTAQANGTTGINDAYNLNASRLNQQYGQAVAGYDTQQSDTEAAKQGALTKIGTSANNTNQSLMRLLGLAGAGNSSAAQILAPYAVSLQASQQRGDTIGTYGKNLRDIDTARNTSKSSYDNNLQDLGAQKNSDLQNLIQGILGQKQGYQSQLANAQSGLTQARGGNAAAIQASQQDSLNKISQYQSALDNLFNTYRNPTYNVAPVDATAASLSDYTVDPAGIQAQQSAGTDDTNYGGLNYYDQLKDANSIYS